ncbi:hypothetical protein GIY56_15115, partial [Paracoccus sp. YIM 132242]|nr:hypothetical protein [Paracoccus lichenicola]
MPPGGAFLLPAPPGIFRPIQDQSMRIAIDPFMHRHLPLEAIPAKV